MLFIIRTNDVSILLKSLGEPAAVTCLGKIRDESMYYHCTGIGQTLFAHLPSGRGVIKVFPQSLKAHCTKCNVDWSATKYKSPSCEHLQELLAHGSISIQAEKKIDNDDDEQNISFAAIGEAAKQAMGARKKSFVHLTDKQKAALQKYVDDGLNIIKAKTFLPAIRECVCNMTLCTCDARCGKCGCEWSRRVASTTRVTVYGDLSCVEVTAAAFACSNSSCSSVLEWDGDDEAIMRSRTSRTSAVFYSFAAQVLHRLWETRFTVSGAQKVLASQYALHRKDGKCMTQSSFQSRVWEIIYSWDCDYQESFSCPICGPFHTAPILIMDGKKFAIQYSKAAQSPTTIHQRATSALTPAAPWVFKDRVLIADATTRTLLMRFSGFGRSSVSKDPLDLNVR